MALANREALLALKSAKEKKFFVMVAVPCGDAALDAKMSRVSILSR